MAKKQINHYQEALKELQKEAKSKGKTFELSNRYSPYNQALEELSTQYKLGEKSAIEKAVGKERASLNLLQRHLTDRGWEERATNLARSQYAGKQLRDSDLLRKGISLDPITQQASLIQKNAREILTQQALKSAQTRQNIKAVEDVGRGIGESVIEAPKQVFQAFTRPMEAKMGYQDTMYMNKQVQAVLAKARKENRPLTQDEKTWISNSMSKISKTTKEADKLMAENAKVDKTKLAGAMGGLAVTAATMGLAPAITTPATSLIRSLGERGVVAALGSVPYTMLSKGKEAGVKDYATGAATAATLSTIGTLAQHGIDKLKHRVPKNIKMGSGEQTTTKPTTAKTITDKLNKEGGYANLNTNEIDQRAGELAKAQATGKEAATGKIKTKIHQATSGAKTVEGQLSSHSEQGKKIANKLKIQTAITETYKGEGEKVIRQLDKADDETVNRVINAITNGNEKVLTGKEKKLAQALKNLTDSRFKEEVGSGVKVFYREGYVPKMTDGSKMTEIKKWLLSNNRAKDYEIILNNRNNIFTDKKAFNEYHRAIENLPSEFYLSPKESYAAFNRATAERLADVKVWGLDKEMLRKDVTEIAKLEGGTDMAKYIETYFQRGSGDRSKALQKIDKVSDYIIASKMKHSVISNATQTVNTANVAGYKNTGSAIKKVVTKKGREELEKKALSYGIGMADTTESLTSKIGKQVSARTKGTGLVSKVKYAISNPTETTLAITQFDKVEKFNRLTAVGAGENYIKQLVKNPLKSKNARILSRLGINPQQVAKTGLTKGDLALGVRNFVGETHFYTGTKDIPLWTSSDLGGLATRLNRFGMKQTQHIATIAKEAQHGNFAPLVRWGLGSTAVGELAFATRSAISGKKREYTLSETLDKASDGDINEALKMALARFKENVDITGGLGYMEDQISGLKYGKTAKEKLIGASGPIVSSLADIIETSFSIASGLSEGDKGEVGYGIQQATKKALQGSYTRDFLTNYKRLTGQEYFKHPAKDGKKVGTKDLTTKQHILKGIEESSTPYDPRSEKYWDIRSAINNNITREEIEEVVKKERKGQSIKDTPFYAKLMKSYNKLDNPKKKKQVRDFLKELGI